MRWTEDEITAMLKGVMQFGCNWKEIKNDPTFGQVRVGVRCTITIRGRATHFTGVQQVCG